MGRGLQIVIGLYVVWLIVFIALQGNRSADRDLVGVVGLLPIWGPLLAIAVLSVFAWLERRIRRR